MRWLSLSLVALFLLSGCGGPPSLDGAVSEFENTSNTAEVRAAAVQDMVATGDVSAVPHLLTALEDDSALVRAAAAGGLGYFRDLQALDVLANALGDPNPEVSREAGRSLLKYGAQAVDSLILALEVTDADAESAEAAAASEERRVASSKVLVALGSDAVAPMEAALARYERESFYDAMRTFANPLIFRSEEVAAVIEGDPADPAEDFAEDKLKSVARFLGRIANHEAAPRRYLALSLKTLDVNPQSYLDTLAADENANQALIITEGIFGDLKMDAINQLITKRESEEPSLRVMATHYLGYVGVSEATDTLVEIINERSEYADPQVKLTAVRALGNIASAKAISTLIASLRVTGLRDEAASQMEAIGSPATNVMLSDLNSTEPRVRAVAIWFFGNTLNPELQQAALPALLENLTVEFQVLRDNAAVALAQMPDLAFTEVAALAEDENPDIRKAVADCLGEMRVSQARPYLEVLAEDDDSKVKGAAYEALKAYDAYGL